MSPVWDDVFSPSPELVKQLIWTQFPKLEPQAIDYLGEGWDCVAYRCTEWVFRFPRRPLGVETLSTEINILPQLGWEVLVGKATPEFPYPFLATPFQAGTCLESYKGSRDQLASELGYFLRELHARPRPKSLSPDHMGRLDLDKRVPQIQAHLGYIPDWIPDKPLEIEEESLLHGDLYCRHIYVTELGGLAGVIDWGDLHRGHRAVDLACGWSLFEGQARNRFWDSYGPVDTKTRLWSRFRALYHTLLVRDYSQKEGEKELHTECDRALAGIL